MKQILILKYFVKCGVHQFSCNAFISVWVNDEKQDMKRIFLSTLTCLALVFSSCEKTEEELLQQCFTIKILDEVCGTAVVQILDEDYYKYGVNGYQLDGVTYDHVFSTELSCADLTKFHTLAPSLRGLVVDVKMLKQMEYDPACTRCAAIVPNAPAKWIPIKFSENCK